MQQQHDYAVIFITAKDKEEAEKIARLLLKHRQAACVSIIPAVDSHFWWHDKLESARESLLIIKSKASLLTEIVRSVKKNHSNEVPEIIALPIIGGNQEYLDWLDSEVI
jgi:periplasmic divalent cation tolerance protein